MTININPDDLCKVAEETKDKRLGRFSPEYYQLNFDMSTGELWTDFHCSLGANEHTFYQDDNIIFCGNLRRKHSTAELAELVDQAVEYRKLEIEREKEYAL